MSIGFGGILGLVEFNKFFVYKVGINRIFMLVEFGKISGLVESNRFFHVQSGYQWNFYINGI